MAEEPQKSYYAIIPANVRYDKSLPANAKLLYGEITALCNEKGYCWASNDYFASLYDVSKCTISRWIAKLAKSGYIKTEISYKEGTREIANRYIYLCVEGMSKNVNTPIDEKVKENITSNNTTSNNKERRKGGSKNSYELIINGFTDNEDLREALFEFIKMRKANKKTMTDRALKLLITNLEKLSMNTDTQIAILNQSIEACWTGVYPLKRQDGGGDNGANREFNGQQSPGADKFTEEDAKKAGVLSL